MKGFEIFFESIKSQLGSKLDVITSVIHFMLVNDDFVCLGVGEEITESDKNNGGSELLPTNWNQNQSVYSLKYHSVKPDKLNLLLKGVVAGDRFIISLLPINSSNNVHSVGLKRDQYVTDNFKGNYSEVFVNGNVDSLGDFLSKNLLNKLRESVVPSAKEGQGQEENKSNLLETSPFSYIPHSGVPSYDPFQPFPDIGRRDLDPFAPGSGIGGGGMFFQPFPRQPGPQYDPNFGIRPGSIPPGARFDPTGPLRPNGRFRNPNPDHFPPPGGYDPFL